MRFPSAGIIRRILLITMLMVAVGYNVGVHFGWIPSPPRISTAPARATAPSVAEGPDVASITLVAPDEGDVSRAFAQHRSGVQVRGSGTVRRLLPEDDRGSRHQRFILHIDAGPDVLVAHNIDLARRVPDLAVGARVEFCGEYEWNERGGLVHWTHSDPAGHHVAGWLKAGGVVYR